MKYLGFLIGMGIGEFIASIVFHHSYNWDILGGGLIVFCGINYTEAIAQAKKKIEEMFLEYIPNDDWLVNETCGDECVDKVIEEIRNRVKEGVK